MENSEYLEVTKSIIVPCFEDRFVMTFNSIEKCWEFPMGEVSENENIIQSSIRQVFERCGGISEYIKQIGIYENIYIIYMSKVALFEPKPRWSDADLVKLFDELPDEISDKDILLYKSILKIIRTK